MLLLGLDIGTTGARGVAIDEVGTIVASARCEYATHAPRPGWVEQEAADWWRAAAAVLARLAAAAGVEIGVLGLTGQRGSLFVDRSGDPVRPAIVDGDRRAVAQAAFINQRLGTERVIEVCGSPALPGDQAPAILWLRDVEPVQFRHTHRVLRPKDYVRLVLTGEAATDTADAAGTLLLDLRRRRWSDEILDALEIPAGWMPPVHESVHIAGGLRPTVARRLGLPTGLPVIAGASASATAALSTGIVTSGLLGSAIGSDGQLSAPIDSAVVDPRGVVQTACDPFPQRYHLTSTLPSAGASLRWWRDILGGQTGYAELVRQAEAVVPGAGGLFFVPHVDGDGASRADGRGHGAFVGLRAHHTPADLTRALLEGVVFSLRERFEVMRGLGVDTRQVRATGGGARSRLWREIQADVFALPIAAMESAADPAVGAALLAAVAIGVFSDVPTAAAAVARVAHLIEPDPDRSARYERLYRTFGALDPLIRQPSAAHPT